MTTQACRIVIYDSCSAQACVVAALYQIGWVFGSKSGSYLYSNLPPLLTPKFNLNNKLPYHLCTLHLSICLLPNPNSTISLSIPFSTNASIPELGIMIVKEHPVGTELVMSNAIGDDEIDFSCDPYIGLEFFNADDALKFYISYANRMGFKVRIGQLYRSRTNGSVSSRRYVCSKEGHQLSSRTGCPAFIRVQLNDSGKWVVDHFHKDHNHSLENESENFAPTLQSNGAAAIDSSTTEVTRRPRKKKLEVANDEPICPFGVIDFKRLRKEELVGQARIEPHVGQEFNTPNEAYQFYHAHAAYLGFGIRIGQLFRSKNDGLITSRRFVCSKEGFQHPSRVGCKAYLRIKRQPLGKWVVDRLEKDHNHDLGLEKEHKTKNLPASNILTEELNTELVNGDIFRIDNYPVLRGGRQNHIRSDWYNMLLEESWSSSQELKSLMLWSLRETASKYIDAGASSIEKYKLAYEILREGGRKLCWHR
ncbi:hypothetical protein P8452_15915 [Trifolium repens]|nr:hypothetical protein P8452_15915 [Trifolium repens]